MGKNPNPRPPSVIEYTNILHEYGVGSKEAKAYKKSRADNECFLGRAEVLDRLFVNKDAILAEREEQ